MNTPTLTISSKNYSSWSLRGWLLMKFADIEFEEIMVPPDDPEVRAEILLLSSSVLVPCLEYEGIKVWDTMAIAEFINELRPQAGLLPAVVLGVSGSQVRAILADGTEIELGADQGWNGNTPAKLVKRGDLVRVQRVTASAVAGQPPVAAGYKLDQLPRAQAALVSLDAGNGALRALSGGYSRDDANARLARNHGMIASFSRALTEGLSAQQSDEEFDATLDATIAGIYAASLT